MFNPAPFKYKKIFGKLKREMRWARLLLISNDHILTDDSLSRSHTKLNHLSLPNVATFLLIRLTRV